jgi:ribonuclease HI
MKMTLYTDGGCEPNPGKGCWSFVCVHPYHEQSGSEANTTNNRMEIMGVLKAVEYALERCAESIHIISDSQYVVKGVREWSPKWERNNWMKKDGFQWVPVKNAELWKELLKHRGKFTIEWVRGHNGNEFNEVADRLVRTEYEKSFGGGMRH